MPRRKIPIRETHELRDDKTNYLDKELESEKRSKVYNTEIINNIIKNIGDTKADMMPFFHGKIEWRNSDIVFENTPEEWEILQRCAEDPIFFIENYCTFLTDYGRKTVKLREYQKDVIHLMCDEHYDEEYQLMLPDHRRVCLLQSRQTGKCLKFNTIFQTLADTKKAYEIFLNLFIKNKFVKKTLGFLFRHSNNFIIDRLLYYIFLLIYRNKDFKEKLIDSRECDIDVETTIGFVKATKFYVTRPFTIYRLTLEDNYTLECADEHLVFSSDLHAEQWRHVCELTEFDFVYTKTGWKRVLSVIRTKHKQFMCDISINTPQHSYYSNGILSHNTTTTAAIFCWYLTFHNDKNAMVVANKGQTAEEILGKMTDMFKGLPFFLKPGVRSVSTKAIRFENGCSLRCSATSDTPATGDTLHMLMVDECALIPANKIVPFWTSVFPTMSSSNLSQIIVMSTPRGRHNLYYDIYSGAINGTNGFVHKRVDYWEVPGHETEEWKQDQIAAFGEAFFNQEFALSFDSDMSKLIGPKDLKFFNRIKQYFRTVEINGIPQSVSSKILWHPHFHPDTLSMYDRLKYRILLQIDTAEGKQKGEKGQEDADWNIINIFLIEFMSPARINYNRLGYKKVDILDCVRYRQIGIYMDQDFDEEKCAEAGQYLVFNLFRCGQIYNDFEIDNVRISLELNFNGANWIKNFMHHDLYYPNLILKTLHSQKATKPEPGFKTVGGNHGKGYWCEAGAKMMAKRQIIISQDHKIPNQSSLQQLEAFGKNKNNVYEGSCMHDDISVTCLFVSIATESEGFKMWIEDWMMILSQIETNPENKKKMQKISYMMETYINEPVQEEYSEDDVLDLIATASSGFNGNSSNGIQNGFGEMPVNPNGIYGTGTYRNTSFSGYQGYGYNQSGYGGKPGQTSILPRKRF